MRRLTMLAAAASLALGAGGASAATIPEITVIGGGFTSHAANGGCLTGASLCVSADELFDLGPHVDASGTVGFPGVGTVTATFELFVEEVTFVGSSGNVGEVIFTDVTYSGSATVLASGDPLTFFSAFLTAPGPASVSGKYSTKDGLGNIIDGQTAFAVTPSVTALNCSIAVGFGQCGIGFSQSGFTISLDGQNHDFVQMLSLVVDPPLPAPEPGTALLFALGLAAFGARSLSARRS